MFRALKDWRFNVANRLGVPPFQVLHQKVLVQIAVCLPADASALAGLRGIGPKTREKYGEDILGLVRSYREKHNIETVVLPKPREADPAGGPGTKKKAAGMDTRQVTRSFFEQGMDIQAIADERGLALSTIQGHLCHFIEQGAIPLAQVVDEEKQAAIEAVLGPDRSFKEVKDQLGPEYSYGDIKAVVAHQRFAQGTGE